MRDVTSENDFGQNLVWELEIARFVWLEQAKKGSLRLVHKYDQLVITLEKKDVEESL